MSNSPSVPDNHVRPRRQPPRARRSYHPYSGRNPNNVTPGRGNSSANSVTRQTTMDAMNQPTSRRLHHVRLETDLNERSPPGQSVSLSPFSHPNAFPAPSTRVGEIIRRRIPVCPYPTHPLRPALCTCPYLDLRIQQNLVPPPIRRPEHFFSHQNPFSSPRPPPRPQMPVTVTPNPPRNISTSARTMPMPARRNIFPSEIRQARSMPNNTTSARGTRSFPFQATPGEDGDRIQSISANRIYRDKSFEELRLEDYSMGNKTAKPRSEEKLDSDDDPKTEKREEENRCVVCLENRKGILLLPCSHMCVCVDCSENSSLLKCPICRSPIEGKLLVFW